MKYIPLGSIVSVIIYICVFKFSYSILGETPVNILGLGSRGGRNLLINLMSYAGVSLFLVTIIGKFLGKEKRWILEGIIGCFVSVAVTIIYFLIWYSKLVDQGDPI
jgi:hypothetical protein